MNQPTKDMLYSVGVAILVSIIVTIGLKVLFTADKAQVDIIKRVNLPNMIFLELKAKDLGYSGATINCDIHAYSDSGKVLGYTHVSSSVGNGATIIIPTVMKVTGNPLLVHDINLECY